MALLPDFKNIGAALFSKSKESVFGLDIGSSFLKIVQLKREKGRAVLETYGELALGPYAGLSLGQATRLPQETTIAAIRDLMTESRVTAKTGGLSIPLGASLLTVMEMPNFPEKQLAQMVPIEARKYIPVPISEVTLDYWIIPKDPTSSTSRTMAEPPKVAGENTRPKSKVDVMVVAIHNETLAAYRDIANTLSIRDPFYELEVFSTARSTFGRGHAPVMIFDLGAGSTKISIVEFGVIRTQHIVNRGSQNITQALSTSLGVSLDRAEQLKREVGLLPKDEREKKIADSARLTLQSILSDANRVLLNYERKYNQTVGKVVLVGGGVLLKGFVDFAQESLSTEVEFADPFNKTQTPAFLEETLQGAGPEFATAIGLALRRLQEMD